MLSKIAPGLLALLIALVGGIYSADWATSHFDGFNALTLGAWTAHPKSGSTDADPYSKAMAARTGRLPLGTAEGLAFTATEDSDGAELDTKCNYLISGRTANARLWTLRITDDTDTNLMDSDGSPVALHSRNIIRNTDGTMEIRVSRSIQPGNWMEMPQSETMRFVLVLYDTAVASSAGISDLSMPVIKAENCNGK